MHAAGVCYSRNVAGAGRMLCAPPHSQSEGRESERLMQGMAVRRAMWMERAGTLAFFVLALLVAVLIGLVLEAKPAQADTFTVNSTGDAEDATPDGTCDSCTLREAIQEANFVSGADTIEFNISRAMARTPSPQPRSFPR